MNRGILLVLLMLLFHAPVFAVYNEPGEMAPVGDADFDAGLRAVKAQQWTEAIRHLDAAAKRHPLSADVHNLLGFSQRKLGRLPDSFRHYQRALLLDPGHRGVHEYIGEAYLMQGDITRARHHLSELEYLCKGDCAEYRQLAQAIREFEARSPR